MRLLQQIVGWLLVVLVLGAALYVPVKLLIVAWLERRAGGVPEYQLGREKRSWGSYGAPTPTKSEGERGRARRALDMGAV